MACVPGSGSVTVRNVWVGLTVIGLVGCGRRDEEAAVVPSVTVMVAAVERGNLADELVVPGRLRPIPGGSAMLTAPAAGVVGQVEVQVGSVVTAGTELLRLDVPELVTNVEELQAAATVAAQEAARAEELFREGLTSRRELERAQAAVTSSRSAVEAARRLQSRAQVRSPLAGAVQQVLVQAGERVEVGAKLAEVVSDAKLDFVASVPVDALLRLHRGQPATVTLDHERSVSGKVEAVSPAVDVATNSGEVVVRVIDRSHSLRVGAPATGRILVRTLSDVIVVPDSAVVLVGATATVFVVERDSIARARAITPGVRQDHRVEIRNGLSVGERIVVAGAYGLTDSIRVVPRAESSH